MSSDQVNGINNNKKRLTVEVTDWNDLVRYVQRLCKDKEKNYKIFIFDEEKEEVRVENQDEFDTNVKFARDQGLQSLGLIIYIDNERKFDGIYHLNRTKPRLNSSKTNIFPVDKLQNLQDITLVDKWYIPVKLDEALGVCLSSAIDLAKEGKLDANVECKQFIETIVPEAFRKLLTTQSVYSWPREIHCGIFDMVELLVDLVGTRLRYPPVPVTLLTTLAIALDTNTTFSQKHKDDKLPISRTYELEDQEFLRTNYTNQIESYGWLRSFIQRLIAQNGLKNLRAQFERLSNSKPTSTTATEYNALLKLFSKCYPCIEARCFRSVFTRPTRQAIKYFLDTKKANNGLNKELNELSETIIELCFNYEMNDEVNEILELTPIRKIEEISSLPIPITPLVNPLQHLSICKRSKIQAYYERLADDVKSLTINKSEAAQKSTKNQSTDKEVTVPLVSSNHPIDGTTDDLLSSSEKRSIKRKTRREQKRHTTKKDSKRTSEVPVTTYDRSDPDDILRFFGPMKAKIASLYDNLQAATGNGNIREVLKIEEKLKLLRPYSARFIADENTPDGTPMQPGQVFRKCWILLNDGSMPWSSEDIELVNLVDGIKIVKQPIIPVTAPHDRAFITVDYMCANEPGTYESKWILAYSHQTFGPMIWCSIEVASSTPVASTKPLNETFELVDVPLPACFDLSKPYQSASETASHQSSFIWARSNSTETQIEPLFNSSSDTNSSSSNSLTSSMHLPLPIETQPDERLSIEIPAVPANNTQEQEQHQKSPRPKQSIDFVDSVVTNIFSVAKQAGSTAKAILNTLQATDQATQSVGQQGEAPANNTRTASVDDFFEHIDGSESINQNITLSNDPLELLIEMGFGDSAKNQRLLVENNNDLNKVIELLADDN